MTLYVDKGILFDNTLTLLQKVLISQRIASHEAGSDIYPAGESRYHSIEEWERETGRNFFVEYATLYRAAYGTV